MNEYFSILGQRVSTLTSCYGYTYADSMDLYAADPPVHFSYGTNHYELGFYNILDETVIPFNILTFWMQEYGGDLSQFHNYNTYIAWDSNGEVTTYDGSQYPSNDVAFYVGYTYDGQHNSVHFVGGFVNSSNPGYIINAHSQLGYNGMSLDTGPNSNDTSMASMYLIRYISDEQMAELENDDGYSDFHRGHGQDESQQFVRGEGYLTCMNGQFWSERLGQRGFVNTTGITFMEDPPELQYAGPERATSYYFSGVWWAAYPTSNLYGDHRDNVYHVITGFPAWNSIEGLEDIITPEDPPEPEDDPAPGEDGGGGIVNGGGGGGRDGFDSDTLEPVKDMVPQTGFVESGLGNIYNVPSANLRALSNFLWSDDFIENVKQLNANAMDCIYNLTWMPIDLSTMKNKNTAVRGAEIPIFCGNVDTRVNGYGLRKSYGEVWYKNIDLSSTPSGNKKGELYGTALDYHPNTTIQLYLPFVGMTELDPNDVLSPMTWTNKSCKISIQYIVNLFNGDAVAKVYVDRPKPNGTMSNSSGTYTTVIGQFECNIGFSIPLTGGNYAQYYKNKFSSVVGMVAGGANALTSMITNPINAFGGVASSADSWLQGEMTAPQIMKAGSASGASAPMSCWIPYVEILRPAGVYAKYEEFRPMNGIPANNYCSTIGALTGAMDDSYYEFVSVKTEGFHGTDEEEQELLNILKTGVYINS